MEINNQYERVVKLKTRYATTLFVFCMLFILAIWLLNISVEKNQISGRTLKYWSEETNNILGRYHSYKLKNSHFFKNIIISSIRTNEPYKGYDYDWLEKLHGMHVELNPTDGSIKRYWGFDFLGTFYKEASQFGKASALIFSSTSDKKARLKKLEYLNDRAFKDQDIKNYIKKDVLGKLNDIYGPKNEQFVLRWIVYYQWSPLAERFGFRDSEGRDLPYTMAELKEHFYQKIINHPKSNVDSILFTEWNNAFNIARQYSTETPKINLPALGLSVGIEDILLVAGPILAFFQILFMIYWYREKKMLFASKTIEKEYLFPDFNVTDSSESDPKFVEYSTRILWKIFLLLPIGILLFGFFTRYDVASVNLNRSTNHILTIISNRSQNVIYSGFIDLINLGSLAIILIIATLLTQKKGWKKISTPKIEIYCYIALSSALTGIWFFFPNRLYDSDPILFTLQWFLWLGILLFAIFRNSNFIKTLSIIVILINVLLATG